MSVKTRLTSAFQNAGQYIASLNQVGSAIGVVLLLLMCSTVMFQIVHRWFLADFGLQFVWTESLSRYIIVIITFYGTAIAMRDNEHVKISFLMNLPPRGVARAMATFGYLLMLVFTGVLMVGAVDSYHYNALPGTGRQFHVLPQQAPFTRDWLSLVVLFSSLLVGVYILRNIHAFITDENSIETIFGHD